ncbi:MAG TPA: HAD-IB family hydrolase [Acidimicrobiales bacterium]|nr:HAD-IB family hydrolase [Acidimicrobiales bacterium]
MAEATRRRVAAFDFDGTLVPGDSLVPFLWRVAGHRRFVRAALRHGARVLLATGPRIGSRDRAKAAFLRTALAGLDADSVSTAGRTYAEELAARVDPAARHRVEWHRARGDEVVMVSASLHVYLAPFARLVGFDEVIATRLSVGPDGRLTGGLEGANVRAQEKVDRLRRWLSSESCELWAYGDSSGDRELLAIADHGFYVPRRGFSGLGLPA